MCFLKIHNILLHKMLIDGVWIVLFLSAVWTLILTAPIHCHWWASDPNLFWWRHKLIYIMDGLRMRTFQHIIWVKYSFKRWFWSEINGRYFHISFSLYQLLTHPDSFLAALEENEEQRMHIRYVIESTENEEKCCLVVHKLTKWVSSGKLHCYSSLKVQKMSTTITF